MRNRYTGYGNSGCVVIVIFLVALVIALRAIMLGFSLIAIYLLYFTGWKSDFLKLQKKTRIIIVLTLIGLNILVIYLALENSWFMDIHKGEFPRYPRPVRHMDDKW
jgi:phosphoglycerol transferase MdoB-like AlkP superfamily enzyme